MEAYIDEGWSVVGYGFVLRAAEARRIFDVPVPAAIGLYGFLLGQPDGQDAGPQG